MDRPSFDADHLLNQLQNELNRVLEQTGRLFAAANQSKAPPIQQTARLKQALPGTMGKFHHALDQLEDELQLAQTVMRRDLAVLRVANGSVRPAPHQQAQAQAPKADIEMTDAGPSEPTIKDTEMQDATTSPPKLESGDSSAAKPPESTSPSKPSTTTTKTTNDDLETQPPTQTTISKPEEPRPIQDLTSTATTIDAAPTTANPEDPELEEPQPDDPFGPTTVNTDLDSIFGESITNDNNEFSLDETDNNDANGAATAEFDFESFAPGNELIPGLQDYANTHPVNEVVGGSDDPEFDAIFGDTADLSAGQQNGQPGQGEAPDTTFDDFINDFSMGTYDPEGGEDQNFDFGYN